MSKILLVSFELTNPGQNQNRVVALIKGYTSWARLEAATYLVRTDLSPVEVRENLRTALLPNDKVFVGSCPAPAAWYGLPEEVSKWIQANQV